MRILCFGDSNTYGYDPRGFFGDRYDAGERWPNLLARQTGWEVINLGANDLLQGASAKVAAARMEAFLGLLLPHCRNVLLVAPPPMERGTWVPTNHLVTESIRLAEEYKLLAQKLSIPFADTREWNIALTFDGVHFTEDGHHTFAIRLFDFLSSIG